MLTRCCLASFFVFFAALAALADDATQPSDGDCLGPDGYPPAIQVFWENDGTFFKPNHDTDRHYTNGVALAISGKPQLACDLAQYVPFHESFAEQARDHGGADYAIGVQVGQLMFTPENLSTTALIPNDRPYAGYLYGAGFFQRADEFTLDHFQVEIGTTGRASLAEEAQETIHKVRGFHQAHGWVHQVPNEFQTQFYLRKKWKLIDSTVDCDPKGWNWQLIPSAGGALGTVYRNLEGGLLLRAGFNLPDDFGPARLADLATMPGRRPVTGWGAYGFARLSGRAVEHNVFLEGANWAGGPGVPVEHLVGEVQCGAAVQYHWQHAWLEGTYSQTFSTKEFEGQHGTDAYGAFMLTFNCPF